MRVRVAMSLTALADCGGQIFIANRWRIKNTDGCAYKQLQEDYLYNILAKCFQGKFS